MQNTNSYADIMYMIVKAGLVSSQPVLLQNWAKTKFHESPLVVLLKLLAVVSPEPGLLRRQKMICCSITQIAITSMNV